MIWVLVLATVGVILTAGIIAQFEINRFFKDLEKEFEKEQKQQDE